MKDNSCSIPYLPLYLDNTGEVFAIVDRDLFSEIYMEHGPWYIHKARKGLYVRSWGAGHVREYLHALVQRLRKRRRPSEQHVVRHLSGNTMDNRDRNLRWGTRKTNAKCAPYVGEGS